MKFRARTLTLIFTVEKRALRHSNTNATFKSCPKNKNWCLREQNQINECVCYTDRNKVRETSNYFINSYLFVAQAW